MDNETRYLVKWRTNRPHEKNKIFEWEYKTLEKALEFKRQEESIKETVEVKIFKVEITEMK